MPKSNLEAVIWDMDGVIVDTGPYHFKAWQGAFKKRGIDFPEEDFRHYFGQRNDTIIRGALGADLSPEQIKTITEEKETDYRRRVAGNVRPLLGAIELIKLLVENGIKTAIASSAPLANIDFITRSLNMENCFQAIVFGAEVSEGKPSPQGFLLAAQKLGVKPRNCMVVEDAVAGVAAARRAGMKCLAVTNSHPAESLAQANLIRDTLEGVTLGDLTALFN